MSTGSVDTGTVNTTTGGTGTQPVSIASSSSAAAAGGSVINVGSLVSQLVEATQAPQQDIINNQMESVTTQISDLGTLKSAVSTFQQSLSALDSANSFNAQTASSSNPTVFTAAVTSGAPVGNYAVMVSQLAQAQQLLSAPLSLNGGTLGTGTLTLSLGSSSFNVSVNANDSTPDELAAAINSAAGNPGITATVIQGTNGPQLLLSSTQSGAANTIQVSVNETDGGATLSALTYPPPAGASTTTPPWTVQAQAQDALYTIAGVAGDSASNTISNALNGVTLTLTGVSPSTTSGATTTTLPATLSVATDSATIESNIQNFVAAYNTLVGSFTQLGGYDSSSNTAGPMMGNPLLEGTQQQIQSAIYSVVNTGSSTYNSLAIIGITSNPDGTLSVNSQTLSNALSTNFSAVNNLFSSTNGVATQLNSQINNLLASNGMFATSSTQLEKQEDSLTNQTNQLQIQMNALSASLTEQYSSLNTLLSSLQTTSSYLTQAFASLPSVTANNSGG